MTNKQFIRFVNDLQIITIMLQAKYTDEENVITDLFDSMDLYDKDEVANSNLLVTGLMQFAEAKEEYEMCEDLLILKKLINNE